MTHNPERVARIQEALRENGLDALIATLPADVLLLTGYWPVTGTAIALATRDGEIGVLAPDDEQELAERGWAKPVHTFQPGSLQHLETLAEAVRGPLVQLRKALGLRGGRVGYRRGAATEASTYAAIHLYGASILDLSAETFPQAELVPADALLTQLASVKTPPEIEQLRRACRIAEVAYQQGADAMRVGQRETAAAEAFRVPFSVQGVGFEGVYRADGFVYCMAGPDAVLASGAYARSRSREIQSGDLALVHCNSYADGYWTDITRTFHLGTPDKVTRERAEAVMEARAVALARIAPGVSAAVVDNAARSVLEAHGLGTAFKHATGHGVGFAAFDPNALPRVHPVSPDVLETGMVFNIEPAVYLEGWGGLRHCDMVTVTESGYELLTPFLSEWPQLVLSS